MSSSVDRTLSFIPLFEGEELNSKIHWSHRFTCGFHDLFNTIFDFKEMGTRKIKDCSELVNYSLFSAIRWIVSCIFGKNEPPGGISTPTLYGFIKELDFQETMEEKVLFYRDKTCVWFRSLYAKSPLNDIQVKNSLELHGVDRVIFDIFTGIHMSGGVVDLKEKKIIFYDPQGFLPNTKVQKELKLIQKLWPDFELVTMVTSSNHVPHDQKNLIDCAVIWMDFMEYASQGHKIEKYNPSFQQTSKSRNDYRINLDHRIFST